MAAIPAPTAPSRNTAERIRMTLKGVLLVGFWASS